MENQIACAISLVGKIQSSIHPIKFACVYSNSWPCYLGIKYLSYLLEGIPFQGNEKVCTQL